MAAEEQALSAVITDAFPRLSLQVLTFPVSPQHARLEVLLTGKQITNTKYNSNLNLSSPALTSDMKNIYKKKIFNNKPTFHFFIKIRWKLHNIAYSFNFNNTCLYTIKTWYKSKDRRKFCELSMVVAVKAIPIQYHISNRSSLITFVTFVAISDIRDYNFHEFWNKSVLYGCTTSYVRAVRYLYYYFYFKFADVLF